MNDELERIWKGAVVLLYYFSTYQEVLTVNSVPDQIRTKHVPNTSRKSPLHDPTPVVRLRAGSKHFLLSLKLCSNCSDYSVGACDRRIVVRFLADARDFLSRRKEN
jgi:hypothetical protein